MKKIVAAFFSTTLLTALASCSDSTSSLVIDDIAPPPGLAVSNPVRTAGIGASIGSAAVAGGIVYVSASPGTFPDALGGTLYNEARQASPTSIRIVDGGFDPVAIVAEAGDDLRLELTYPLDRPMTPVAIKVPARRPPRVVRTNPPRGRTDVAFNVQVEAVFSEPLNRLTVAPAGFSLVNEGIAVPASIELSSDGLIVKVVPNEPLEAGQDYILVSNGVQDLDGEALETTVTSFRTAFSPKVPGGVASLTILPFSAFGINDNGVVVGTSGTETVLWRESVITSIPNGSSFYGGRIVNDALTILGQGPASATFDGRAFTSTHAVQWKDGTFTDLGTLPGHNYSDVWDISPSGDIVGTSAIWDGDPEGCCADIRAVIWHDGEISELPFIWPYAINARGEILGGKFVESVWRTVIWRDGTATLLTGGCFDEHPAGVGLSSVAMNNSGQIAATCGNKVYLWQNGQSTLLPMLSGCNGAIGSDIDDSGRVVGYAVCDGLPNFRAVVWINGSAFQLPGGNTQSTARKINNRGEIIGYVDNLAALWVITPTQ